MSSFPKVIVTDVGVLCLYEQCPGLQQKQFVVNAQALKENLE
jgi:hypothetical protein